MDQSLQSILHQLPGCATVCIEQVCPSANEACLCPHKRPHYTPWTGDMDSCLLPNCTSNDYLITAGMVYNACDIPTTEMNLSILICITAFFQILFYAIRIWPVVSRGQAWYYDDISITVAFTLLMLWIPILSLEAYYGFYPNISTLQIWRLDAATKVFFAYEVVYCLAIGTVKISIAFLYFRILDGRKMRIALWAVQVLNVLVIISFLFGLFFSCTPLARYWAYSYVVNGTCSDFWDWSGYYTGFQLLLDILLIVLPSSYVWRLRMDKRTKVGVIGMFFLGLITMAMTIMRFIQMHLDAYTIVEDDLMSGLLWSTLEVTTAFIIACMPAARLLFKLSLPAVKQRVCDAWSIITPRTGKQKSYNGVSIDMENRSRTNSYPLADIGNLISQLDERSVNESRNISAAEQGEAPPESPTSPTSCVSSPRLPRSLSYYPL